MDLKKEVLGSLRSMLDERLAGRLKPKAEEKEEASEAHCEGPEVGPGSEKDVYPNPDANMEEGIPQEGMPAKVMKAHDENEFSDSEREELKKLFSHGE